MIVRAGRVLWEGEAAGDVVHRRVRKEGEAALKRVAWKPSLHCQKPSIAIKQLVAPMHAASENPVDEIMTAARSLFAGPGTLFLALSFAGPQWLRAAFDGCVWACRAGEGCGERHAELPRNLVPPVRTRHGPQPFRFPSRQAEFTWHLRVTGFAGREARHAGMQLPAGV